MCRASGGGNRPPGAAGVAAPPRSTVPSPWEASNCSPLNLCMVEAVSFRTLATRAASRSGPGAVLLPAEVSLSYTALPPPFGELKSPQRTCGHCGTSAARRSTAPASNSAECRRASAPTWSRCVFSTRRGTARPPGPRTPKVAASKVRGHFASHAGSPSGHPGGPSHSTAWSCSSRLPRSNRKPAASSRCPGRREAAAQP
mmetsp:Transcript_93137/g.263617  ORF Transcript_93137/g.263617 Transcript_93137/m.263617 type:complete len:200 (+) Transcript_93137:247-846(+)